MNNEQKREKAIKKYIGTEADWDKLSDVEKFTKMAMVEFAVREPMFKQDTGEIK